MRKTDVTTTAKSPGNGLEGHEMNRRIAVFSAGVVLAASLIAAASAPAAPGDAPAPPQGAQVQQDQQGTAPGQGAGMSAAHRTPQAAIDYVKMMKDRAALRDRASALRQQTIQQELAGQAPASTE